jgi:hypothetical protein
MVITKNPDFTAHHTQFNGINHVNVDDHEAGIYMAFLEFALHQTIKDERVYAIVASSTSLREQKALFVQLTCLKSAVIDKIKMNRSNAALYNATEKKRTGMMYVQILKEVQFDSMATIENAYRFALQREKKTLALYTKLAATIRLPSTETLIDYLIKSQCDHIRFLETWFEANHAGAGVAKAAA